MNNVPLQLNNHGSEESSMPPVEPMNTSANQFVLNRIVTSSEKLKHTEDYKKVVKLISRLVESGIGQMGQGYCISVSDIIYTLLSQRDIKCNLIECQVALTNRSNDTISLIGYDAGLEVRNGLIDTHVVVVTETEIPMMIDMSIGHRLPNGLNTIIDEVRRDENKVFCSVNHPDVRLTYQEHEKYKLPLLHQTSIVNRIETDRKIFSNIGNLKKLIFIAIIMVSLNMMRGAYDFYQTYHVDGNYWGPSSTQKILDRLEKLEKDNASVVK